MEIIPVKIKENGLTVARMPDPFTKSALPRSHAQLARRMPTKQLAVAHFYVFSDRANQFRGTVAGFFDSMEKFWKGMGELA